MLKPYLLGTDPYLLGTDPPLTRQNVLRPLCVRSQLPYKRVINAALAALTLFLMQAFVGGAAAAASLQALYVGTAIAGILGLLVTAGVGGGDMPVVIT